MLLHFHITLSPYLFSEHSVGVNQQEWRRVGYPKKIKK